jgi:hypothetical protein
MTARMGYITLCGHIVDKSIHPHSNGLIGWPGPEQVRHGVA